MDRKESLLALLRQAQGPVKGSELARALGVSRQTLVQDIAFLRKDGFRILSTTRGYLLEEAPPKEHEVIGISHPPERLRRELEILVAHHVEVADVIIEHPVYGTLRAELGIRTPKDIGTFMKKWRASHLPLLSEITGGHHYHTLVAEEPEYIEAAIRALEDDGFPVERT
ncbi:MAG: transcription repressor NadR [Brockia lithotrophica]|nr:transcription repressor NadR [Brockia lithotrophica]